MIIRITINDNDFAEDLEKFAEQLFMLDTVPVGENYENINEWHEDNQKFTNLWHKMMDESDTLPYNIDNEFILEGEVLEFFNLCMKKFNLWASKKKYGDYLKKKIKITFHRSITCQWENGEVVYLFLPAVGNKTIVL